MDRKHVAIVARGRALYKAELDRETNFLPAGQNYEQSETKSHQSIPIRGFSSSQKIDKQTSLIPTEQKYETLTQQEQDDKLNISKEPIQSPVIEKNPSPSHEFSSTKLYPETGRGLCSIYNRFPSKIQNRDSMFLSAGLKNEQKYANASIMTQQNIGTTLGAPGETRHMKTSQFLKNVIGSMPKTEIQHTPYRKINQTRTDENNNDYAEDDCPTCFRPTTTVICVTCGHNWRGRMRKLCPQHNKTTFLYDSVACRNADCQSNDIKEF